MEAPLSTIISISGPAARKSPIHVLKGNHGSLLSYKTATALGIINLQVRHVQDTTPHDMLCTKYPTLFHGIEGVEVNLHIDERVTPVAQPPR